jgi:3-dehydrosphinganine reductase
MIFSADVRDSAALNDAVEGAISESGSPDLVVASAGMVVPAPFVDLPPESFRETVEINYLGSVNLVRSALPAMLEKRSGHIVLISSGAGLLGLYGYSAYAPTKFAVRGFAEALRSELAPEGIRVSVVYPPDTDTPQLREEMRVRPLATSKISSGGGLLSADAVARAILRGVARNRFTITAGTEMALLARLHSVLSPALNRLWFDPIIARCRRQESLKAP